MIDFDPGRAAPLAVAGRIWDIAGAFFLGKALVFSKDKSIMAQAGAYWDFSLPLLLMLCEQRVDARFGLSLLGFGFFLQIVASIGMGANWGVGFLLLVPILLVYHWHSVHRSYLVVKDALSVISRQSEYELSEGQLQKLRFEFGSKAVNDALARVLRD